MSYQKESFGMMDEGYFVPRGQIIDWINNLLQLNVTKIQQLGAGSIYCQIVDVIHPGKIPLNKINWKAKNDYEFINNLKLLQNAFDKAGVKRHVDVEKLAKAKYQDNLEFIQWLKRYYDINCGDRGKQYNAKEKRGNCVVDFSFADKNIIPKSYNGGGQIIAPKNEAPVKKVVPISNKSGIETKFESLKIQNPAEVKLQKTKTQKKITSPKHKIQQLGSKNADWKNLYEQQVEKNKELFMKINMIEEVLISDENSDLKVAMLQEILSIVRNIKPSNNVEKQKAKVKNYEEEQGQENQDDNQVI